MSSLANDKTGLISYESINKTVREYANELRLAKEELSSEKELISQKNKELKENCKLNGCNISVNTLIKEGLLNEEDVNNSKVINIYYENNEQKVKIS